MRRPQNESETHYILKEVAKYILYGMGYKYVATEVFGMHSTDYKYVGRDHNKDVIDTVGVKISTESRVVNGKRQRVEVYDVRGIEAKASLEDYKNGFCAAPSQTYIIAPKGVIPVDQIPDPIGLIEVDLAKLRLKQWSHKIEDMKGVTLTKRAKKRLDKRFKNKEKFQEWCKAILKIVALRATKELLFWRGYLDLE